MISKCPKCEQVVRHATVNEISLDVPGGSSWLGLAYVCPACQTILGVQMDPVALKTDTIAGVAEFLRRR